MASARNKSERDPQGRDILIVNEIDVLIRRLAKTQQNMDNYEVGSISHNTAKKINKETKERVIEAYNDFSPKMKAERNLAFIYGALNSPLLTDIIPYDVLVRVMDDITRKYGSKGKRSKGKRSKKSKSKKRGKYKKRRLTRKR